MPLWTEESQAGEGWNLNMFGADDLILQRLEFPRSWNWKNGQRRLCFVFPERGGGVYSDDRTNRPFSAGDVLVLNTGLKGAIRTLGREALAVSMFQVHVEQLVLIFPVNEFCLVEKSVKTLAGPWFYGATSSVAARCRPLLQSAPRQPDVEHRCHLLRIVALVLSEEFKSAAQSATDGNLSASALNHVLDSLSLDFLQTASVKELAGKYGYSRRHLNRLFHEKFGLSVSALKMEMRLLRAVTLLRNPVMKIAAIAADCGFNHVSLFSARFRKRYGMSPHQWRDQARSPANGFATAGNGDACPLYARGLCPLPADSAPGEQSERPVASNKVRKSKTSRKGVATR